MLSKARRAAPDIDRDIKDCAAAHAHELALRAWRQLVMEAPHCAGTRIANVVVLDKNRADPGGCQALRIPHFREKAAMVADAAGHDDFDFRQPGVDNFDHGFEYCAKRLRGFYNAVPEKRAELNADPLQARLRRAEVGWMACAAPPVACLFGPRSEPERHATGGAAHAIHPTSARRSRACSGSAFNSARFSGTAL